MGKTAITPFITKTLPEVRETHALARKLAQILLPGDVVLLEGTLGAGKTTLAQGLIDGLCRAPQEVTSPTFTLVQTYKIPQGVEIWHFDLYRIEKPGELIELGIEDAFTYAISIIEWPERLGEWKPQSYLNIALSMKGDGCREAVVSGSAEWEERITGLFGQDQNG